VGGVPHHRAQAGGHRDAHHRRGDAQEDAHPLFPQGNPQLLELFVQMVPLLVQEARYVGH
jgi:hypothetical protein